MRGRWIFVLVAVLALMAVPAVAGAVLTRRTNSVTRSNAFDPPTTVASTAHGVTSLRPRWSIQPTPNPSAPSGQLLFGTCTSASSCVAVGTRVTGTKVGVTLVERWTGGKWRVQRTPDPAGAKVSSLAGVACSTPSTCTAVGYAISDSGKETTLVERWNGHTWRIQPTPNPPGSPKSFLVAAACSSPASCTAVGAYINRSGRQVILAERWSGKNWRIQPTPTPGKGQFAYLDDVSCSAFSACTAVGVTNVNQADQRAVAERWNGSRWRLQSTPKPPHGGGGLEGVACTASSSCTAVGFSSAGTLTESWNGTRWRIQPSPNPSGAQYPPSSQPPLLNSVACSSRSACTAVGNYTNSLGQTLTLGERWNGNRWTVQHTRSPDAVRGDLLLGVACPSFVACTAFGFSHASGTPLTMAQRWDGHRWRLQRTANRVGVRGATLLGLSCTSRSSCVAVGQTTAGTFAERWNGMAWAIEPTPSPVGTAASALNGVSCTSPSTCTAVGAALTGFNGNPVGTLAEHWNGKTWRIQPTPTSKAPGALNAVSCTSGSACTAVGGTPSKLLAERWNGRSWKTQSMPSPTGTHGGFLAGVSCSSSSVCTAVGVAFDSSGNFAGTVTERWDGHSWHIQPTPTSTRPGYFLGAVSCTSASACTAVGASPSKLLAERWNGTAWSVQPTPTPPGTDGNGGNFSGVSCFSSSACTAVGLAFSPSGPFTVFERWNGTRWSMQATPNLPGVYDLVPPAVSCPTSSICTAVGGYTNNGVTLTLAERWSSGGRQSQPVARPLGLVNQW